MKWRAQAGYRTDPVHNSCEIFAREFAYKVHIRVESNSRKKTAICYAVRDGRACLARVNSQARTGTGEKNMFSGSADNEKDLQPYPLA